MGQPGLQAHDHLFLRAGQEAQHERAVCPGFHNFLNREDVPSREVVGPRCIHLDDHLGGPVLLEPHVHAAGQNIVEVCRHALDLFLEPLDLTDLVQGVLLDDAVLRVPGYEIPDAVEVRHPVGVGDHIVRLVLVVREEDLPAHLDGVDEPVHGLGFEVDPSLDPHIHGPACRVLAQPAQDILGRPFEGCPELGHQILQGDNEGKLRLVEQAQVAVLDEVLLEAVGALLLLVDGKTRILERLEVPLDGPDIDIEQLRQEGRGESLPLQESLEDLAHPDDPLLLDSL